MNPLDQSILAKLDGKHITVGDNYEIELDRIDTKEKLLFWTHHLCEKSWITPQHIRQLNILVSSIHGWNLYLNV